MPSRHLVQALCEVHSCSEHYKFTALIENSIQRNFTKKTEISLKDKPKAVTGYSCWIK